MKYTANTYGWSSEFITKTTTKEQTNDIKSLMMGNKVDKLYKINYDIDVVVDDILGGQFTKLKYMIAYKLMRKMRCGSLSPLFINKKSRLPLNEWLDAESHPTKGFSFRKGWHCTLTPNAPHLNDKDRVWVEVEVNDYEYYNRPESQGGTWVLAQKMKIIKEIDKQNLHIKN